MQKLVKTEMSKYNTKSCVNNICLIHNEYLWKMNAALGTQFDSNAPRNANTNISKIEKIDTHISIARFKQYLR